MRGNNTSTTWRILRWPLLLSATTIAGLATGLLGTGLADAVSWITLGGLIAVMLAAYYRSRTQK